MFVFNGNALLVHSQPPHAPASPARADYRSYRDVAVCLTSDPAPEGTEYQDFRWLLGSLDPQVIARASFGLQMWRWDHTSRFCGCCGSPTEYDRSENCKACPTCGDRRYPAQFPVAIVAVTKGDQLLLGHNLRFPEGMYSVVAGYTDLGETIEETARREVLEETGIVIGPPRYLFSQNWAPSSSLMLGFHAEWLSGEVKADGVEITHADWFSRDRMPSRLPMPGTIGNRLVELFLSGAIGS